MNQLYLFFLLFAMGTSATAQQTIGLFEKDPESYDAYTLFSPGSYTDSYLIDNCGELVHSWDHQVEPGNSVYLLPDGDLLRAGRNINPDFPGAGTGGIIERVDWNNNFEWQYMMSDSTVQQHHDIYPMPNGNVMCLAWEKISRAEAIANGRDSNMLGAELYFEVLIELRPLGFDSAEVVWRWSAFDHLVQDYDANKPNYGIPSMEPRKINFNFLYPGQGVTNVDWLHANGINYNAELDQVAISVRSFSEIWLIDHSTTSAEAKTDQGGIYGHGGDLLFRYGNAAAYGRDIFQPQSFFFMHNPEWIEFGPNAGAMSVFNNRPGTDTSRLNIFTPTQTSPGVYELNSDQVFTLTGPQTILESDEIYSPITSSFQVLPNGNYFACAGQSGRFIEFEPDGNKVWEYQNPVNNSGPQPQTTSFQQKGCFRARKYGAGYAAFDGRSLTPQGPIELNPIPSNCTTGNGLTLVEEENNFWVSQVGSGLFELGSLSDSSYDYIVYDLNGQMVMNKRGLSTSTIDLSSFPTGLYLIKIEDGPLFKLLNF